MLNTKTAFNFIRKFIALEASSGIVLLAMTATALVLDNSPLSDFYQSFFRLPFTFNQFSIPALTFWINEGLMTFFFLIVGLELKRELFTNHKKNYSELLLAAVGALGGMLIPSLIYILFNYGYAEKLHGWAIPVATDIAFSLTILGLFGKRIPLGLKLFLMALAIFDDVGAILIIAIFYGHGFSYFYLLMTAIILLLLYFSNNKYLIIVFSILLWFCLLKSGIHPTLSGIFIAFTIQDTKGNLEKILHPYVAFGIIPLFALANAGISFSGLSMAILFDTITLGIIVGLFFGKQLGVFIFSGLYIYFKKATLPEGSTWLQFYGVSILCGIGFTMSLFLGTLAFQSQNQDHMIAVRLGVLLGSLVSSIVGAIILNIGIRKKGGGF